MYLVDEYRDLSSNNLEGRVPSNGSFSQFTPIRFASDNSDLGKDFELCSFQYDCHFFAVLRTTMDFVALPLRKLALVILHRPHLLHRQLPVPQVVSFDIQVEEMKTI